MADTQNPPIQDLRKVPLSVHVGSPDHVYYDGQAKSVSASNEKGPLDILPAHENFISIIRGKLIIIDTSNKKSEFKLDKGVMHVNNNKVEVFLGIPTIDLAKVKQK